MIVAPFPPGNCPLIVTLHVAKSGCTIVFVNWHVMLVLVILLLSKVHCCLQTMTCVVWSKAAKLRPLIWMDASLCQVCEKLIEHFSTRRAPR